MLRVPLLNRLARHVFFGRGSFPDVEMPDAFCGSPHCAVAVAGPQFSAKTKSD
jgi:hypothetical protein